MEFGKLLNLNGSSSEEALGKLLMAGGSSDSEVSSGSFFKPVYVGDSLGP